MENRNVRYENGESVLCEKQGEEAVREASLSEEERHALVEFFELLDQWDRELVQNVHDAAIEVNLCRTQ